MAKYAAEGVGAVIVSATRGEAGIRGVDASEAAALREAELRRAAAELGVSRVIDGGIEPISPGAGRPARQAEAEQDVGSERWETQRQ